MVMPRIFAFAKKKAAGHALQNIDPRRADDAAERMGSTPRARPD
jgi:hypothetical protein